MSEKEMLDRRKAAIGQITAEYDSERILLVVLGQPPDGSPDTI